MKDSKNFSLLLLVGIVLALAVAGCRGQKKESNDTQHLVVERQYAQLAGISEWDIAEFAVDVPVKGPQPLLDSIKSYLNKELFYAFQEDAIDTVLYKAEEVYTDDMTHLLDSYVDKYADRIKKDLCGFCNINMFMIAQTESFVTYGIECYHGSGSTGSAFLCYSFDKKDGHRIENIITRKDVMRFFQDSPDAEHSFSQSQMETEGIEDDCDFPDVGLAEEGLLIIDQDQGNHYAVGLLNYKEVLPYLSKEARKLVKNMGKSTSDCFVGDQIGFVKASDGRTIVLIETPSRLTWSADGIPIPNIWESDPNSKLQAFYVTNDGCVPATVIDGKSVIEPNWDDVYSSNPNKTVFAFDASKNNLYIPLPEIVMMGVHDCNDRYNVWHFDGKEFVLKGEDGGFWLHPSLRKFGRLSYAGVSEDYLVRVDEMRIYDDRYDEQHEASKTDTCRYRYAAWKNNNDMLTMPDLVIENGYWDEAGGCYVFENNGYRYVIFCDMGQFSVFHNGKSIFNQRMHDISLYQ